MHEWSYEQGADYYLLRYLHEAWDNESTGFTIECRIVPVLVEIGAAGAIG
jgi:hypothetical protein